MSEYEAEAEAAWDKIWKDKEEQQVAEFDKKWKADHEAYLNTTTTEEGQKMNEAMKYASKHGSKVVNEILIALMQSDNPFTKSTVIDGKLEVTFSDGSKLINFADDDEILIN